MKTRVFITADVEFSIAGAFGDSQRYRPVGTPCVYCVVEGQDNGIGFIMRTLENYGLRGTFFVEVLNTHYFGDGPMMEVAQQIAAREHDVQIHLHPSWLFFQNPVWWQHLGRADQAVAGPDDSCANRGYDELVEVLEQGVATLRRWGLTPVAARAGNLQVNRQMYRAMAQVGLPLSSHVGVGLFRPTEPDLQLLGGCEVIEGVTELPVLTYFDPLRPGSARLLTIAGASRGEMEHILWRLREMNLGSVVILTHPFEFVRAADMQYRHLKVNRVTQGRLEWLCRFLWRHSAEFQVETFSSVSLARLVPQRVERGITVPIWSAAARTVQDLIPT